jgi:hypothetical protein
VHLARHKFNSLAFLWFSFLLWFRIVLLDIRNLDFFAVTVFTLLDIPFSLLDHLLLFFSCCLSCAAGLLIEG